VRDLLVLVDATVPLVTERRQVPPWGLAGGRPGAVGEKWLLRSGDEARAERLPAKCAIQLKAGDVLRMLTPGGVWGDPARSVSGAKDGPEREWQLVQSGSVPVCPSMSDAFSTMS